MKRLLSLLAVFLLVAGCANIPLESQPVVVSGDKPGQAPADVPEPAAGIDPLTVTRQFIRNSAAPGTASAAARVYLDDDARRNWKPSPGLTIIDDTFGTVYDTSSSSGNPDEQVVNVRGFKLGTLSPDSAFLPVKAEYSQQFKLRKQPNGQWRIVDPPQELAVTDEDFALNYFRVPISFYSPDSGAFVPDLRYVAAKPQAGLPGRVMDLVLQGPSEGLKGAVKDLLGGQVTIESNVRSTDDGTLDINLTGVGGASLVDRNLIAAQIVLSLQTVTLSRVRLLADGTALVPEHEYWRSSELPNYNVDIAPNSELLGLMTVNGRVRSLGDGQPVGGPAGNGGYKVVSAAQSVDGKRLAVVEERDGRQWLRVGDLGHDLASVDLFGGSLSRPTWRPVARGGGGVSGEVWTVVDHNTVARVTLAADGRWVKAGVDATMLTGLGQITELRLSRDGSRLAAVVNGQLVVASIVRTADSVALRAPRKLQERDLKDVVDVDWATQDHLIAATSSTSLPVVKVPLDGQRMDPFSGSNLTPPVHGVTAAPSRQNLVADAGGLWVASELGEVWRPQAHTVTNADPFYPG
ncbi:LpqB family beta-propeller domain-containing protein [Amycolatopsis keratiniphila]|uniref:Lipoprotein n=1 Tax=Amycolatopsis keratiniphila TaxID=129921 RepID=R4T3K0_9PSEU|nr:LpqB family beta-propeller domain-containing protein [Amycolatopsis keratiniphila]AGM09385.1 lipoprotein [Amycolatopsis keratiniphila]